MNALRERKLVSASGSDMTPMVDVTFLLLIFFMVTAAFTLQRSIVVPKPTENGKAELPINDHSIAEIIVEVDDFNTYHVTASNSEHEAPSEHDLVRVLRHLRADPTRNGPLDRMLVKANPDALHEKVVAALDSGAYVGISEIKLLTLE